VWAADLGAYPETDDYIEPCAKGVDEELERFDFAETLRQRDELLVNLLEAKKKASQIP
jgi:carnitine 3-dehydrogenase